MEIWKEIHGYSNYEISNYGRVRKNYLNSKQKILKTDSIKGGYLRYTLCKDGKTKRFIAHRLVAEHFIDNPNNLPHVNHIDNNTTNNYVGNLEWCTPKQNAEHRDKQNRHTVCKTVYQYDKNFNLIATYRSTRECARETGYAKSSIPLWCAHKLKPANPYIWSYIKL